MPMRASCTGFGQNIRRRLGAGMVAGGIMDMQFTWLRGYASPIYPSIHIENSIFDEIVIPNTCSESAFT